MSSFRRVSVEGTSGNISTVEDAIEDRIRYLWLEGSDLMLCLVDTVTRVNDRLQYWRVWAPALPP
jgi:hypothetical protein